MGVSIESWCFCKGVSKTERMKATIFSGKGPALARIFCVGATATATGFLIHRNLLLTTHVNLPSVAASESAEIRLQNGIGATLVPHRFFITSSVLDLTIVGLDTTIDGESSVQVQQPYYLKTCSKSNLDLGSLVYLLGCYDVAEKQQVSVGEGKVVIATDNLIKLSTDGIIWSPGSAGFDVQGNLAFMICDPMKLATSPNCTSSSSSSSSSTSLQMKKKNKDTPMQFGIPIPIICDWLNQHWEGSLDQLTKPKLPIIRLMSTGQKSEHSSASFTMRRVFKSTEANCNASGRTPSESNVTISKVARDQEGCTSAAEEETEPRSDPHAQGIPTPEIYKSPKLTAVAIKKKEIRLLDINFPPRIVKSASSLSHPPVKQVLLKQVGAEEVVASSGSVNGAAQQSEVLQSSSSSTSSSSYPTPIVQVSEMQQNGYNSSEGEATMYSAETAESRNYTSPREGKLQQMGRSQSCIGYNSRWETQRSLGRGGHGKKTYYYSQSQGGRQGEAAIFSQRSNDYYSPTVSSIMKKRNSEQQSSKPSRQNAVAASAASVHHTSPRWMF